MTRSLCGDLLLCVKVMKKIITLIVCCCLMLGLCSCKKTTRSVSLEDYLESSVPLIYSELLIFPSREGLEESTVETYQSTTVETLLFDDVYFLLRCNYSSQKYEQEVLRIKELGAQYQDKLFQYPSYVMLFSSDFYEYALLDADNYSIVYVYAMTTDFNASESIQILGDFPKDYLPIARPETDIIVYEYDD